MLTRVNRFQRNRLPLLVSNGTNSSGNQARVRELQPFKFHCSSVERKNIHKWQGPAGLASNQNGDASSRLTPPGCKQTANRISPGKRWQVRLDWKRDRRGSLTSHAVDALAWTIVPPVWASLYPRFEMNVS